MNKQLNIVHLYPKEMNIYGDTGNRLILQKRLLWRNIDTSLHLVGIGDSIPADTDIIIGGGGQDAGQDVVQKDLKLKAPVLQSMAQDGVVMLMICGLYQLFGRRFITGQGNEIQGIGLLPLETIAGDTRLIGNTLYQTLWGEVVGYENHSGKTTLDDASMAFGTVLRGAGNNGEDKTEGCVLHNVFGTYSHGPVLSKNPKLADELLLRALARKYSMNNLQPLNDTLEQAAALTAKNRPR
ncbi:glutamine amidotransferase [Candidatus Saccharibacteria bacterium]|nr:glutamine amidotransferase [Candidatus Saccharibacteria bacterium]NCU40329.1 glutamine amidotransferase [Candidatus Saccharibacteria bacterium]